MKMNTEKRYFETDIDTENIRDFEIKQSPHMLRILSDTMYSDKPLAVVRELSCNAWDAHIEAGTTDRPFDIHLPNNHEPFFSIRDYGVGLSEDDLYGLYCTYGGTNKDNSNDFTGGFGLGSKSPFAYTDQFTVTSYFEGVKSVYSAFVAESGVFQVVKVSDEETDEHNGLEVYVPVKTEHFDAFEEKCKLIFKRFPVLPKIKGCNEYFKIDPVEFLVETELFKFRKEQSQYYYRSYTPMAIQGLVAYKIDVDSIQSKLTYAQKQLLNCPIDLVFDIGDIGITAPREAINYDTRTEQNIIKKLDEVIAALPKLVEKDLKKCNNRWEAEKVRNEWFNSFQFIGDSLKDEVLKQLTYKGKPLEGKIHLDFSKKEKQPDPIDDKVMMTVDVPYADVKHYNRSAFNYKNPRPYSHYNHVVKVKDNTIFIYDDTDNKQYSIKLKYHFEDSSKDIYFIRADKKHLAKIKRQLAGAELEKWSDYAEPPKELVERETVKRQVKKILKYNYGQFEDCEHDVNTGGVYVITYSRRAKMNNQKIFFNSLRSDLRNLDIDTPELFGIQTSFKKIPETVDGWVHYEDWAKQSLDQYIANLEKSLAKHMADCEAFINCSMSSNMVSILNCDDIVVNNSRSEFTKLVKAYKEMEVKYNHYHALDRLCKVFDITYREVKPSHNIETLYANVKSKYPLLKNISSFYNNNHTKQVEHYINLCDSKPSMKYEGEI